MEGVNYASATVPPDYQCENCHVTGVKLWRQYQTFKPRLLCASCASTDQHQDISDLDNNGRHTNDRGDSTDQIGWYVPAVPDEEGEGFWGYISVPQEGVQWWRQLPNDLIIFVVVP